MDNLFIIKLKALNASKSDFFCKDFGHIETKHFDLTPCQSTAMTVEGKSTTNYKDTAL
jgi:hypothetical protein